MRVTHIKQIDITILQERGIKGIIFDLDDTLVKSFEPTADPDVSRWLAQIQREFAVFIVSNNASDLRVRLASEHLGVMGIAQAGKPSRRSFRKALQLMNLQVHEVAIVGDQLFTDILGGNRLGALTILVDPLSTEVGWHRNLMRAFERYIL
jgi:HAD superfamily phosphatase (TIGR01668 family)